MKVDTQYYEYCEALEVLQRANIKKDEQELLGLLIETYEKNLPTHSLRDPIELVTALMEENNLKAVDLAEILGLSKGTVSKILNRQTGLSKNSIRVLAEHFKVSQAALNQPYALILTFKIMKP